MKQLHKYREALQNRSIQPSKDSWELFSKKLDAHDNLQQKSKWHFLKYAAIILVLISVALYFFKPKTEVISTKENTTNQPKESKETKIIDSIKTETNIATIEETTTVIQPKKSSKKTVENSLKIEDTLVFENNFEQTQIAVTTLEENEEFVSETYSNQVSDEEIEQLLNNAQLNISLTKNLPKKGISAQALLTEVEDDLDKDFKEKLVETIVTTLKTPRKIVISDRGN
jgi:hypothetical protein